MCPFIQNLSNRKRFVFRNDSIINRNNISHDNKSERLLHSSHFTNYRIWNTRRTTTRTPAGPVIKYGANN